MTARKARPSDASSSRSPARLLRAGVCGLAALLSAASVPVQAQDSVQAMVQSLPRDTEIEDILRQDANPIFTAAGLNASNVRVHIISDKDLNAFVTAGQQVFITTGLIMETKTPNELQGVIAHETGHIAGGHIARQDEGMRPAMATMILTLGLGVLAAIAGAPDAAAGLAYSSSYFATLNALGYSRIQEASADQAGATYLEKAGLSGAGLVDFFDHFRYQEVFDQARRYKFFQSHPLTSDRIEALRVRVEAQPHFAQVDSPEAIARHAIMVAKLKGFMNPPSQTFVDYKETDTSLPARYARAIAYYRSTQTDKALQLIDGLIADYPDAPYFYELKGQTLFESGRIKESEPAYREAVRLKPNAPLILTLLAQTLLATDDKAKAKEAIGILNRSLDYERDNAFTWRLLAQAYDSQNQPGLARLATAEQDFALGQSTEARVFAMRAREKLTKGSPDWRRATDIVLASEPTKQDLQDLAKEGSTVPPARR